MNMFETQAVMQTTFPVNIATIFERVKLYSRVALCTNRTVRYTSHSLCTRKEVAKETLLRSSRAFGTSITGATRQAEAGARCNVDRMGRIKCNQIRESRQSAGTKRK